MNTETKLKEIFRTIEDYPNYMISNLGRVKSLSGLIKRQCDNGNGYMYVDLYKNNKRKKYKVSRLVAKYFVDNPNNLPVVNHIDFNRKNDKATNLEWTTQRENANMKHLSSTSKYVGVCFNGRKKKCWTASIHINGKQHFLGRFEKEYDAHLAYQNKLNEVNKCQKSYS
jgi:hypothetical protein